MLKFLDPLRRLFSAIGEFFSSDLTTGEQRFISSFSSRWLSVAWIFIAASVPILITVEVVSAKQYANGMPQSENAGYLKDNLTKQLNFNPTLDKATDNRLMHSTLLAEYILKITAHRNQDGIYFEYENLVTYRYDTIIALSGLWLVLLYAIKIIGTNRKDHSKTKDSEKSTHSKKTQELHADTTSLSKASDNISVLKDEVQFARALLHKSPRLSGARRLTA